jgi:hypothetical protein
MTERHDVPDSGPPREVARIPVWFIMVASAMGLTGLSGIIWVSAQLATASADIRGAVERVGQIEQRLTTLASLEARQAVVEAKLEADRQRLDRLETRADAIENRLASAAPH